MANTKLLITALDFDGIKTALQQFLNSQSTFTDYDFTGSALSVLLDSLAYNTHYLGYYLNMVANEMFLDSADLRDSVVSLAKMLNYTPVSRNAATAFINFVITPSGGTHPAVLIVPQYTQFTTSLNGITYTFVTMEALSAGLDTSNNTYSFNNVEIREGLPYTFTYTADTTISNQKFTIPNANVDTSTVNVRVQNSSIDTTLTVFSLAGDINVITGTSPVYFLQEVSDMQYQVYFGDGIVGQALQNGNLVMITYLACNADAPNSASIFTSAQPIHGYSNIVVTTVQVAFGGSERETIDQVRFRAPLNYEAQNRAVTASDYDTLLLQKYPNINSLSIWGGQDNNPPVYGMVFISLQPATGYVITEAVKQFIIDTILKQYNVVTIIPTIIDPVYIFLEVNSTVKYNPSLTTLTSAAIQSGVLNSILNFTSSQINQFNSVFRYSKLTSTIDSSDASILGDVTYIKMQQRIIPQFNTPQTILVDFNLNNPIQPGTVGSTQFVSNPMGFAVNPGDVHGFQDDGQGNLQIYKQVGPTRVVVKTQAGMVSYATGLITITTWNPASIVNGSSFIKLDCTPVSPDITPVRNNIVTIDPADVTITMALASSLLL